MAVDSKWHVAPFFERSARSPRTRTGHRQYDRQMPNVRERSAEFNVTFEPEDYLVKVKSAGKLLLRTSVRNSRSNIEKRLRRFQPIRGWNRVSRVSPHSPECAGLPLVAVQTQGDITWTYSSRPDLISVSSREPPTVLRSATAVSVMRRCVQAGRPSLKSRCTRSRWSGIWSLIERDDWAVAALMSRSAGNGPSRSRADHLPEQYVASRSIMVSAVPWLHIVEAVTAEIGRMRLRRVGLLGTAAVMEGRIYHSRLSQAGIEVVLPEEHERSRLHHHQNRAHSGASTPRLLARTCRR